MTKSDYVAIQRIFHMDRYDLQLTKSKQNNKNTNRWFLVKYLINKLKNQYQTYTFTEGESSQQFCWVVQRTNCVQWKINGTHWGHMRKRQKKTNKQKKTWKICIGKVFNKTENKKFLLPTLMLIFPVYSFNLEDFFIYILMSLGDIQDG